MPTTSRMAALVIFLAATVLAGTPATAQTFQGLASQCSPPTPGAEMLDLYFEPCELRHLSAYSFDEFAYQGCFKRRAELREKLKAKPACVEVELSLGPYDFKRATFPVEWSGWLMGDPRNLGAWLTEGVPTSEAKGPALKTAHTFLITVKDKALAERLRHSSVKAQCVVNLERFYLLTRAGRQGMSAGFAARLGSLRDKGTITQAQHDVALGEIGDRDTAQGGVSASIQACRVLAQSADMSSLLHHWPASIDPGTDLSFPASSLSPSHGATVQDPTP